jgi:hypothetical protein
MPTPAMRRRTCCVWAELDANLKPDIHREQAPVVVDDAVVGGGPSARNAIAETDR